MKIKSQHFLIPLAYSGLFFLTNYFDGGVNYLDLALFAIGVVLGVVLMYLDEAILHKYYLEPRATKINLITRSLLFMISLVPLGLFIVTSTGSELGIGLFSGITAVLFLELFEHRKNIDSFHSRFLFQLKRKLDAKEISNFIAFFSGLMLIFILFTFFLGR